MCSEFRRLYLAVAGARARGVGAGWMGNNVKEVVWCKTV